MQNPIVLYLIVLIVGFIVMLAVLFACITFPILFAIVVLLVSSAILAETIYDALTNRKRR